MIQISTHGGCNDLSILAKDMIIIIDVFEVKSIEQFVFGGRDFKNQKLFLKIFTSFPNFFIKRLPCDRFEWDGRIDFDPGGASLLDQARTDFLRGQFQYKKRETHNPKREKEKNNTH
jgi:hypothetical protein